MDKNNRFSYILPQASLLCFFRIPIRQYQHMLMCCCGLHHCSSHLLLAVLDTVNKIHTEPARLSKKQQNHVQSIVTQRDPLVTHMFITITSLVLCNHTTPYLPINLHQLYCNIQYSVYPNKGAMKLKPSEVED